MKVNSMSQAQTLEYYKGNNSARWVALIVVCIGSFLTPLSLSSVHIATPAIAEALHANAIWVGWIPAAFILSNVVSILPAGRCADILGRKLVYATGICCLGLASISASLAPSIEWLIFSRVLQGLASSMVFACSLAIVSSVFNRGQRGMALGCTAACIYLGLTGGPLIGGWLTEAYGWRSVFLFPVPLVLACLVMIATKLKGEWFGVPGQKLDWVGSSLFAMGAITLFLGISNLPSVGAFILLLLSIFSFWMFIKQQEHTAYPLVRLKRMWRNRMFSRSLLTSIMMYGANYSLIFLLSLYLQYIQGMSATDTGQLMMLQALTMAIVAPIAGRLSDRYEPRLVASLGCAVVAAGLGILQWIDFVIPGFLVPTALVTIGLGFGLFSTPNTSAAMGAVPEDRLGVASALLGLARVLGNMLGTALLLLMMHLYIGDAKIDVSQYPALLTVTKISLAFSLMLAVCGSYISLSRGKVAAEYD